MNLLGTNGRAKVATASLTACAVGAMLLPSASAAPAPATAGSTNGTSAAVTVEQSLRAPGTITSRVRGTFGRAGTVRGTFSPDRFFVKRGETYANGVLRATLRRGNGDLVGRTTKRISIPVRNASASPAGASLAGARASQAATCDILNLVLGPLDLNLLGLEVHLNRVVLDIVARTGAGNLLGNLLCAVVGLLDQTGLLGQLQLSNALNRILAVLRVG